MEAFSSEPPTGHMERFGAKLDAMHEAEKESWFDRYGIALRIAAAAIIFIALGTFFYTGMFDRLRERVSDRIVAAELPAELQEVMMYYNVITNKKVEQIDNLAVSQDEATRVKEMALQELRSLDESRKELEKEYALNPNNERIMNALLLNQQKRSEILDIIINALNQVN